MAAKRQKPTKPYVFVSYSTREPHVQLLIDCLHIVFAPYYDVRLTPHALESGASQRQAIIDLACNCSFAVVALDGLRPNVVFEYGLLEAKDRPVLLFKETNAEVDIRGFFRDPPQLGVTSVAIDLNTQFSDVKDVNYASWNRFSIQQTVKVIWDEYKKKRTKIQPRFNIPEPKLW